METQREMDIEKLEARLGEVGRMMETTMEEIKILLSRFERLAAHCRRSLGRADKSPESPGGEDIISIAGVRSQEETQSRGSSPTDTTTSVRSVHASTSPITACTPGSFSVLEARELFPSTPTPGDSQAFISSGYSSPPPRTHMIRKSAYSREQQVRAIMADIKKRMKGGRSA